MAEFDVEQYRNIHESEEHWEMRKAFMLAYQGRFEEDRLVCLASVFSNVELMGCRYPIKTMRLVAELSQDLPIVQKYREIRKQRLQRTFVQASDAAGARIKGLVGASAAIGGVLPPEKKRPAEEPADNSRFNRGRGGSCGPKFQRGAYSDYGNRGGGGRGGGGYGESSSFDYYGGGGVRYGYDGGPAVESPRFVTYEVDRSRLKKNAVMEHTDACGPLNHWIYSDYWNQEPLSHFIIVEREYVQSKNLASTYLMESSQFCKIPITYKVRLLNTGLHRWSVWIENELISKADSEIKSVAQQQAASNALDCLRERCFTIKVKKLFSTDRNDISRQEVGLKNENGSSTEGTTMKDNKNEIQEDNVGNKLLRMMGWTGGGLGKAGQGITEPIKAADLYQRSGLGYTGAGKTGKPPSALFKKMINNVVREYVMDGAQNDLVFSSDFTSEERREIHTIAVRYKVKSHSHGSGDKRFLILSQKFIPKKLLEFLIEKGGETDKYQLIPPSKYDGH